MSEGRIRAWLDTPLKPRTRKTVLIATVFSTVIDGVVNVSRENRIKKLEAQVATLEAWRRTELGDLK